MQVTDLDGLTGLAEYRNGGLFLDCGVIEPRDPALLQRPLDALSEPVVEWRALTVALLDRLAVRVRERLGKSADEFPLARVLEGGSWAAGREIAVERRPDGARRSRSSATALCSSLRRVYDLHEAGVRFRTLVCLRCFRCFLQQIISHQMGSAAEILDDRGFTSGRSASASLFFAVISDNCNLAVGNNG